MITRLLMRVRDFVAGKPMPADRGLRSARWPGVRKHFLEVENKCQWCGGTENLEVHHMQPFHLHPELELDPKNLITLCEKAGLECHLHVGHKNDWHGFNPHVQQDCSSHTWPIGIPPLAKNS